MQPVVPDAGTDAEARAERIGAAQFEGDRIAHLVGNDAAGIGGDARTRFDGGAPAACGIADADLGALTF